MKKNGFTLAEVLMSLAIVGVIAAVTLPTLHLNVEKQKVGPAFMKAINTLESAATFALRDSDAHNLTDINATEENLLVILEKYTKLSKTKSLGSDGKAVDNNIYTSKDGIYYHSAGKVDAKDGVDTYFKIKIDVNGTKKPDKIGVDCFEVVVLNDGLILVPGTRNYKNKVDSEAVLWTTGCQTIEQGDDEEAPTTPSTCGGSIVENGGRVLYGYSKI